MPAYHCKICGKSRAYDGKPPAEYPFCCERCKLVDLGKWFNGEYALESEMQPDDVEGQPPDSQTEPNW